MTTDETLEYQALRRLAEGPVSGQRNLAYSLGVSLGKANYIIRKLIDSGLVTLDRVTQDSKQRGYSYALTSKGKATKAELAQSFLKRKVDEHNALLREIDALAREVGATDNHAIAG